MKRVNGLINDPDYCDYINQNRAAEHNRPFCDHHFEHLLTVARLTYLLVLESGSPFISREIVYAAALLHDIGRFAQYSNQALDHAQISAELAEPLLEKAGFDAAENGIILKAIRQHRHKTEGKEHRSPLSLALARADQYARLCFNCEVRDQCNKLAEQPHQQFLAY